MRRLVLGQPINEADFPRWVREALREIELASYEDAVEVADAFSVDDENFVETRVLDVTSPSAQNVALVLATFIRDLKKRGTTRNE